jgi:hypothetical protein
MADQPSELDGARVLKHALVTAEVEPTGATRHVVGGVELGRASALAIAKYDDAGGYYLFYLDDAGGVVTDTWHAAVAAALDQAACEYDGLVWVDVPSA